MKKSEAKSQQPVGELEAPISLTPEQLEAVAAGLAATGYYKPKLVVLGGGSGGGATTGFAPPIRMF